MMKRKSHDQGAAHSQQTVLKPVSRVAIHRRRNKSGSTAEILLVAFLFGASVLIGGVFYYHFTSKSSLSSAIIPKPQEHISKPKAPEQLSKPKAQEQDSKKTSGLRISQKHDSPHLFPKVAVLPVFATIPNAESLMAETYDGKPTIAGIISILQTFLSKLHVLNFDLVGAEASIDKIIDDVFGLAQEVLLPFDAAYRGRSIFPVRDDESIFMSLAAFREHLLMQTLVGAFKNAKFPDKLFIGAVVQNCFGNVDKDGTIHTKGLPCRTGAQVIGKNAAGRDQTKVSDAPPDKNGIESFCNNPDYKKYCDAGQIRVLYVHETESLGPAMARYYASKLWGGETYFMQSDSHLQFATHWDQKFIMETKAALNYPKAVLSSYPPGFSGGKKISVVHESGGSRLCTCGFSDSPIEKEIIRVGPGGSYDGTEKRPAQIPFIAAGFFFARAEFLVDVPFDPFMPWVFMGEEIALSVRAWTSGWKIYAPRKNLISHQYRPGRMGLPKFWGSVNRLFHRGAMNNNLQGVVVGRIKNLVGYADNTKEKIEKDGYGIILKEQKHYGIGNEHTLQEYMTFAGIDMEKKICKTPDWCFKASLQ